MRRVSPFHSWRHFWQSSTCSGGLNRATLPVLSGRPIFVLTTLCGKELILSPALPSNATCKIENFRQRVFNFFFRILLSLIDGFILTYDDYNSVPLVVLNVLQDSCVKRRNDCKKTAYVEHMSTFLLNYTHTTHPQQSTPTHLHTVIPRNSHAYAHKYVTFVTFSSHN